jgi:hypothetical protein
MVAALRLPPDALARWSCSWGVIPNNGVRLNHGSARVLICSPHPISSPAERLSPLFPSRVCEAVMAQRFVCLCCGVCAAGWCGSRRSCSVQSRCEQRCSRLLASRARLRSRGPLSSPAPSRHRTAVVHDQPITSGRCCGRVPLVLPSLSDRTWEPDLPAGDRDRGIRSTVLFRYLPGSICGPHAIAIGPEGRAGGWVRPFRERSQPAQLWFGIAARDRQAFRSCLPAQVCSPGHNRVIAAASSGCTVGAPIPQRRL